MSKWQSIKNAPKGQIVNLAGKITIQKPSGYAGRWKISSGTICLNGIDWPPYFEGDNTQPTHWQPLPDPPHAD